MCNLRAGRERAPAEGGADEQAAASAAPPPEPPSKCSAVCMKRVRSCKRALATASTGQENEVEAAARLLFGGKFVRRLSGQPDLGAYVQSIRDDQTRAIRAELFDVSRMTDMSLCLHLSSRKLDMMRNFESFCITDDWKRARRMVHGCIVPARPGYYALRAEARRRL
jgi:hypothetical protein